MSVQRFRSIEEMSAARVLTDRAHPFERFLRHCARYWTIAPRVYPRGVFRFRNIEEAQAARRRVTMASDAIRRCPEPASDDDRAMK